MQFQSIFGIGDMVYLITDPDQLMRQIISITFRPTGVIYTLACGTTETSHYELEVSNESNEQIKLGLP